MYSTKLIAGNQDVYNFSISKDMVENIGFAIFVFSLSFSVVVFSIIIFIHSFTCNINCDLSNKKGKDDQNLNLMPEMQVNTQENTTTLIFK